MNNDEFSFFLRNTENTEILGEQPQTKLKEERSKNKEGMTVSEVKDEAIIAQLEEKLSLTLTIQ